MKYLVIVLCTFMGFMEAHTLMACSRKRPNVPVTIDETSDEEAGSGGPSFSGYRASSPESEGERAGGDEKYSAPDSLKRGAAYAVRSRSDASASPYHSPSPQVQQHQRASRRRPQRCCSAYRLLVGGVLATLALTGKMFHTLHTTDMPLQREDDGRHACLHPSHELSYATLCADYADTTFCQLVRQQETLKSLGKTLDAGVALTFGEIGMVFDTLTDILIFLENLRSTIEPGSEVACIHETVSAQALVLYKRLVHVDTALRAA